MSQTIENRIVEMQFENKQFESGVQESLSTLDKLKKSLNFDDSAKNLQNFSNSVTKNLDMNGIGSAVEKLRDRFSASGIAGMEVIRRLTDFAIDAGKAIASALDAPFAQIRQGGWKRAMNIEDAKFQLKGLSIAWEDVARDIDYAVQDTAFGLDSAAKACAQLSASSVQAGDDMKAALRGISGVASMGNTEYENIAQIFTKAAGNGRVMADELNRISQYGLNARASLAKFFNAVLDGDKSVEKIPEKVKERVRSITDGVHVVEGDISEFASKSKIDFETFAYAMDNAFGVQATKANETFMGSLRNIKAALSKIGAEFATPVIKGAIPVFNEIRVFLNELRKQMGPVFTVFSNIANVISTKLTDGLHKFKLALLDFGAIEHIGNAIRNVFTSVVKLIAAVRNAFRTVFPPTHEFARSVDSIAEGIEKFSEKLVISDGALLTFRNIMIVVFNILKGVGAVIKNIVPIVTNVISVVLRIASVIANLIGYLTTFIMQLDVVQGAMEAIRKAGGLFNFVIDKLKIAFSNLRDILTDTSTVTGRFFMGLKDAAITAAAIIGGALYLAFVKIREVLSYFNTHDPLGSLITGVKTLIDKLKELPVIKNIVSGVEVAFGAIGIAISKLIGLVKDFISNLKSGMSVIKAVGVALSTVFGGAINLFGTLISKIKDTFSVFSKDRVIEESIEMPIYGANNAMTGMVHTLTKTKDGVKETTGAFDKAKASVTSFGETVLTKIRSIKVGQVLLFAFGTTITILAMNLAKLTKSLTGVTGKVTELLDTFINLHKRKSTFLEVMIGISLGIGTLATSLWALSGIPKDKLTQVTICLGSLLTVIGTFSVIGKKGAGPFAASMAAFSGGILLLVGALYAIDQVNMDNIWKKVGVLGSITAGMLAVSLVLSKVAPSFSKGGIAIVAFAGSVYVLAKALDLVSHADLNNIKENWFELSAVILAFAAFASIASNVGMTAALGLIGFIGVLKLLSANTELIKNNFGNIQAAFKVVVDALKSAISYLYNGLKKAAQDMKENETFAKVIQGSVTAVIAALVGTILALGHAGKGLKKAATGFLLIGATIAGLMYVTTKIADMSQKINPTQIEKATELLKSIMTFVAILAGISMAPGEISAQLGKKTKLDYKSNENLIKDIRKLLISMGLLLISIGAFAAMVGSLTPDQFARAKDALIGTEIIIGIIAGLCSVITAAAAKGGKSEVSFTTFTGIVLLLGSLIGSIAVLMFMFSQVDFKRDAQKLIAAGASFVLISTAIILILAQIAKIEKNKPRKANSFPKTLLAFAALAISIGGTVILLNRELPDKNSWIKAGILFGALMSGLVLITSLVKSLEKSSAKLLNTNMRQQAFKKTLNAVYAMILAIVGFAAIFIGFNLLGVDTFNMIGQAGVLVGMLAAIVLLVREMEKFSKDTKYSFTKKSAENFKQTTKYIGLALAAIAGLAVMFAALKDVDAGRMAGQALTLVGTLTALTTLVYAINKYMAKANIKDILKVEGTLLAMVGIFTALALVFKFIINDLPDPKEMLKKSQTVMLALVELEGLMTLLALIAKIGTTELGIGEAGLLGMVALFGILSLVFYAINDLKTDGIMAKSQTIVLVMLELEVLMLGLVGIGALMVDSAGLIAIGLAAGIAGLWAMITLLDVLTDVFEKIDKLKIEGILRKSQTIVLVMLELEILGATSFMAVPALIGALALWPMISLFDLLTEVFLKIDRMKVDGLLTKSQVIILVMFELESILSICSILSVLALAGAPGLSAMVGLFGTLSEVFLMIDNMHLDGLKEKADIIIDTLLKLEGLSAIGGLIGSVLGPGLLIFAGAIQALGAACNMVGEGVNTFSVGITHLAQSIDNLSSTGPKITAWFTSISVGVTTLTVSIMNSVEGLSKSVVKAVNTLITGVVAAIASGGALIFAAAASLGAKLKEGFESKVNPKVWGAELIDNLVSGIRSKISAVASAAASVAHAIWEYLHFTEPEKGDLVGSGQWFAHMMQNFGGSITANMGEVIGPATEIGTKIKDTLSNINLSGVLNVSNMLSGQDSLFSQLNGILKAIGLVKSEIATMTSSWSKGQGTLADREYQLQTAIGKTTRELDKQTTAYQRLSSNGTRSGEVAKKKAEESTKAIQEQTKQLDGLYGVTQKADDATQDFTKSLGDLGEGGGKAAKGAAEAKDAIADFYNSIESAISLFDKFEEEEGMSSEELLSNMESQIFGIANWSTQLQQLAIKGIDQGLLKKLADMGPSGQKYVKAFVSMTADQLAHANELYQQSLLLPQHVTAQVFASFEVAGQNATTGFLNGLDHDQVKTQGVQFAHDFLDNFNAALGIHSPSDETFNSARYTVLGYIDGIESMMYLLENTIKQTARKIIMWFNTELGISFGISTKTVEMGKSIVEGIKTGIEDEGTQSSLFSSLRSLCDKVINEAKSPRGFYINSPSHKFQEVGASITEGLAKGIIDNTSMATQAIGKTSEDVINEMRDTINKANEALIDEVNDPVIKPVLDLSEIQNGSRTLNDMLSRNSAFSASSSFRSLQNQQWGNQSALLNATMDNSDVVSAIDSLKTDISSLKDAMTNIRMVLDTGTMVGAMTPMIDEALGKRMVYAGRGM